jgi:methionine synthase II (cobalamin-independent)
MKDLHNRFQDAYKRLYDASPAVLQIVREMFNAFPNAETEGDDEYCTQFAEAIRELQSLEAEKLNGKIKKA